MPNYDYNNLKCIGCGVNFDSVTRNKNQKYCSKKCAGKNNINSGRFKKGVSSWNAGTNDSGMKGKHHADETKEKMRASSCGDKASNWKGGISSENEKIRKSGRYKAWRASVFERDNFTCLECGDRSKTGHRVELHADHIKQFATHKHLRFDIENGRTLCAVCHRKTDTWGKQDFTGNKAELSNE